MRIVRRTDAAPRRRQLPPVVRIALNPCGGPLNLFGGIFGRWRRLASPPGQDRPEEVGLLRLWLQRYRPKHGRRRLRWVRLLRWTPWLVARSADVALRFPRRLAVGVAVAF